MRVALLQMVACGTDREANLAKGEDFCRRSSRMGADVALFPEMWNNGYTLPEQDQPEARKAWLAQAIDRDSTFVARFRALARELEMAIGLTYLERWLGAPRNTISLIDRHGEIVWTYAKVHTCDFDSEAALTPGDDFYVGTLDTAQGPVEVGAMICFDCEFPESARILMLKGAEIILTPNACLLQHQRIGQFKARAYENMLGVAMANYAAPQENGHSVALDPITFDDDGVVDNCLIEAGEEEGVYMATFDMEKIRAWRRREVWGNAFRKPRSYRILTTFDVQAPFVREDARGRQ